MTRNSGPTGNEANNRALDVLHPIQGLKRPDCGPWCHRCNTCQGCECRCAAVVVDL